MILQFSKEESTASSIVPTLRKMKEFLTCTAFDDSVQFFVRNLSEAIDTRVKNLLMSTSVLHMATLLDPRFGYDSTIWAKGFWTDIEDDLKNFGRTRIGINFDF